MFSNRKGAAFAAGAIISLGAAVRAQTDCFPEKVLASDGAELDSFGSAIATEGTLAVVGAPSAEGVAARSGAAYVLARVGGVWVEVQKVFASDGGTDNFGADVSVSGQNFIVGAVRDDDVATDAGAAYVFERGPTGWAQVAKLLAPDGQANDSLGAAVALDSDVAFVGAPDDDDVGFSEGSVYLFERGPSGWTFSAKITAPDADGSDRFGESVALFGDLALIGASGDDDRGSNAGAVYAYEHSEFGWVLSEKFTSSDGAPDDHFGQVLSLDGDRAAVGAPFDDDRGDGSGSVYVFERSPSAWNETAKLVASDGASPDRYGISLDLTGDRIAVGAPGNSDHGGSSGSAYLVEFDGSQWRETRKFTAHDAAPADFFGNAVAVEGSLLLVGAASDDNELGIGAGALYPFEIDPLVMPGCVCDSGAPCGNLDPGAGCAHFEGFGSRIIACGSTSVAADELVLTAFHMAPAQFAIFFMGGGSLPRIPFGDGQLCVGTGGIGLFRFPVQFSGEGRLISIGPGLVAFTHATFRAAGHIEPGDTWHFQGWYRDPLGPCGLAFNTSGSISVTFVP